MAWRTFQDLAIVGDDDVRIGLPTSVQCRTPPRGPGIVWGILGPADEHRGSVRSVRRPALAARQATSAKPATPRLRACTQRQGPGQRARWWPCVAAIEIRRRAPLARNRPCAALPTCPVRRRGRARATAASRHPHIFRAIMFRLQIEPARCLRTHPWRRPGEIPIVAGSKRGQRRTGRPTLILFSAFCPRPSPCLASA
jgi:hypothetical protein